MEALAALGIACNVVQLVSFCHETAELAVRIKKTGSVDPDLTQNVSKVDDMVVELEKSVQNGKSKLPSSAKYERLLAVAGDCRLAAKKLRDEIETILKTRTLVMQVLKAIRRSSKIQSLEQALQRCQSLLDTQLLIELIKKDDANQLLQQKQFDNLDEKLQDGLRQYSKGQIDVQQLVKSEAGNILASISSDVSALNCLLFMESEATRTHITAALGGMEQRREQQVTRARLLRSLRFNEMNARRNQIDPAAKKTFEWVFEPQAKEENSINMSYSVIRDFLSGSERMLWIKGKAASGKSTLMKFLVEDPRTKRLLQSKAKDYEICSFFLWNTGTMMEKSLRGMYSSLLYQMLLQQQDLIDQLLRAHSAWSTKADSADWSVSDLNQAFRTVFTGNDRHICFFIDGLDEMGRYEDFYSLENAFHQLTELPLSVKVCLSSRPERFWNKLLEFLPSVELPDLTSKDMRIMAENLLRDNFDMASNLNEEDMNNIISTMIRKADGVFLWLRIAVQSIRLGSYYNSDSLETLEKRLEGLPDDLNHLYRGMWDRLGNDKALYRKEATRFFKFVAYWKQIELAVLTTFHLTVACHPDAQEKFLNTDSLRERRAYFISEEFAKICQQTKVQVESRCAGLLECSSSDSGLIRDFMLIDICQPVGKENDVLLFNSQTKLDKYRSALNGTDARILHINFIHRTVRDFLFETSDGLEILEKNANDNNDSIRYSVFLGSIAECLLTSHVWPTGYPPYIVSEGEDWSQWVLTHPLKLSDSLKYFWLFSTNMRDSITNKERYKSGVRLLLKAMEIRSMTNQLEILVSNGIIDPIDQFLDSTTSSHFSRSSAASYFLWHRISDLYKDHFLDGWRSEKILNLDWGNFHTVKASCSGILQLLPLFESLLFCFVSKWISILRLWDCLDWIMFFRSNCDNDQKLFALHTIRDGKFGRYNVERGIHEPRVGLSNSRTWINIVVEINTACLLNETISRAVAPAKAGNLSDTSNSDDAKLNQAIAAESMMFPSDQVYRRVLLVGDQGQIQSLGRPSSTKGPESVGRSPSDKNTASTEYTIPTGGACRPESDYTPIKHNSLQDLPLSRARWLHVGMNDKGDRYEVLDPRSFQYFDEDIRQRRRARFCEPTKEQSDRILAEVDSISQRFSADGSLPEGATNEICVLAENILAENDKKITGEELPDWLIGKGHFIPSTEDLNAFTSAKSTEERIKVLNNLNRKRQEIARKLRF